MHKCIRLELKPHAGIMNAERFIMKLGRNTLNAGDVCASKQEVSDWEFGNNLNVILMLISCIMLFEFKFFEL